MIKRHHWGYKWIKWIGLLFLSAVVVLLWVFIPPQDHLTDQDRLDLRVISRGSPGSEAEAQLRALRPEVTRALVANLRVRRKELRQNAVIHLSIINDSVARAALLDAVTNNEYADVRLQALRYLLAFSETLAQEAALVALQDIDDSVRIAAMEGIARFPDSLAITPLIDILLNQNGALLEASARTLIAIGDTAAIEPIISLFERQSQTQTFATIPWLLSMLGDFRENVQIKNHAIQALQDQSNWTYREAAAKVLSYQDDPAVVEALAEALREEAIMSAYDQEAISVASYDEVRTYRFQSDSRARNAIMEALTTQHDPTVLPVLVDIYKNCNSRIEEKISICRGMGLNWRFKNGVAVGATSYTVNFNFGTDALQGIRSFRATDPEKGVLALAQVLTQNVSEDLRRASLDALHNSATEAGDRVVHNALKSKVEDTRVAAIRLTASDTHKHGSAFFIPLLMDASQRVRREVVKTLANYDDQWVEQVPYTTIRYLMEVGDGAALTAMWIRVEKVLISDINSGQITRLRKALIVIIILGREELIPLLIRELQERGTVEIATVYVNSGHSTLISEANAWAERHGYTIISIAGSPKVKWGSY